ncbi:uncharacterized protein RJT21DRAFT_116323 [Scheffersomyces amazonensis]|uniref:uncharacterized protein n=1 Tax=Scheffersomyces amazonensis TaxID=1078765 RepID=UPI00315C4BE5
MSAYLFLTNAAIQQQIIRKTENNRKRSGSQSNPSSRRPSVSSTSSSSTNGSTRKSKIFSFGFGSSTSPVASPQVHRLAQGGNSEINNPKEQEQQLPLSPPFSPNSIPGASTQYAHLNEKLNAAIYMSDNNHIHKLMSFRHVQLLRYSYFQEFIYDYTYVRNNEFKCAYMKKIYDEEASEEETEDSTSLNGQSNTTANDAITDSSIDRSSFSLSELVIDEYEEDLYYIRRLRKPSTSQSSPVSPQSKKFEQHEQVHNVENIFQSNLFWNAVYQDIKFENYELYEKLPILTNLQNFFNDYFEYFFVNLRDYNEQYFYFTDLNYQYFSYMNEEFHQNLFKNNEQAIELMITTVIDNFRLKISNSKKLDRLYEMWEHFLKYVILDLVRDSSTTTTSQEKDDRKHSIYSVQSSIISRSSQKSSTSSLDNDSVKSKLMKKHRLFYP